jgi:hypothetical protein
MLTCKEASSLISEQMDNKLAWRKRMALRIHVILCHRCVKYMQDLKKLREFIKNSVKHDAGSNLDTTKLSDHERNRINAVLKSVSKPDDNM